MRIFAASIIVATLIATAPVTLARAGDAPASREAAQRDLWTKWAELWNGSYEQSAIIAPDFRLHAAMMDGSADTAIHGPDGLVAWIKRSRGPFADMHFATAVGPLVSGDYVVGRWTASGSYAGGVPGAKAAAGTVVTFSGTDILRVRDGLIVEYWVSSDTISMLSQLKVY